MNWIKITPKTELPKKVPTSKEMLVKMVNGKNGITELLQRHENRTYAWFNNSWHPVTHMCIITNPEE